MGIIYYITIMRNAQRTRELTLRAQEQAAETRQTQLFMNIISVYTSKEYRKDAVTLMSWEWSDIEDFDAKYGYLANIDNWALLNSTAQWLEGVGVLVKRGLIDPELVFDLLYGWIILFWEKFLPVFMDYREKMGPNVFADLELLYNEMTKLSENSGKDLRNIRL